MLNMDDLSDPLGVLKQGVAFVKDNPILSAGAVTGVAAVAGIATVASVRSRKRKSKKRRSSNVRKRNRSGSRKSRSYKKRPSTKKIRINKRGQPFVVMANGQHRFISKKSARLSRKRKGGRY